jgi:phosphate-selective porin OprO/OprP
MAAVGGRAAAQIGSAVPDEPPVPPPLTDTEPAPGSAPPAPTGTSEIPAALAGASSPPAGSLPLPRAAEASPPVPPPPVDGARLDEIEQLARIAARKQEIYDEQSLKWDEAAKRIEKAPITQVDDNGFAFKLADGSYALRLRALVQADGRGFLADDALQASDTFLIRRFRPSLDGTLFGLVDYRLLPELAAVGGAVQLLDAYTDIHPWAWLRLRVGRFKGPIGLERLQSDADLPLLERALDSNLSSVRELGVQLWGDVAEGVAQYAVALFNGTVDGANADTDFNHAKDLAARLFFQPLRIPALSGGGSLGIGIAGSFGNRKGKLPTASASAVTGLPSFRSDGQNTFFQYLAPTDTTGASTVFTHQLTWHLNPQLYYYYETLGFLAEYVVEGQGVQKGNTTTTLTNQAAHATVSYVFNGKVGFDGVTPTVGFDRKLGAPGAFELALRWDWLRVDPAAFGGSGAPAGSAVQYADPTRSARSAQGWTAGFTWVPRRSVHLAIDFGQTSFTGGAGATSAPVDRKTENVLIARSQVNF